MPTVFRENYRDPRTGAVKKRRKYTIKYRVRPGVWKRVSGYADKEASVSLGKKLELRSAREAEGLVDPFEQHQTTELEQHIKAFESHLEAKGNCSDHVTRTVSRIRDIVNACGFERIAGISASAVEQHLAKRRKDDEFGRQTSNYYLGAIKSFCRWLVLDRRTAVNALSHLKPMSTEGHQTFVRRTLKAEEFTKLINAARAGGMKCNLTGEDRAMVYMVAAYTGYRANELASVTADSFRLADETPSLEVTAGYSKRRRRDVQPLRADLAAVLTPYLEGRMGRVWPGQWHKRAAEMLRVDLAAAGIQAADDRGRVVDFHALRHCYITMLHRGGTYGRVLQALARHSTPTLTARYTHVDLSDVDAAIAGLPALPTLAAEASKKPASKSA